MPKLPATKPRQVIRFLEQNGFVLDHASGSHFVFYHPTTPSSRSQSQSRPAQRHLDIVVREAGFTREELLDFLAGR
jgi:hypothetical protein